MGRGATNELQMDAYYLGKKFVSLFEQAMTYISTYEKA